MSVSYATEAQQPGRIGKEVAIPKRNQAQISPLISLVSGGVAGAVEASITVSIDKYTQFFSLTYGLHSIRLNLPRRGHSLVGRSIKPAIH